MGKRRRLKNQMKIMKKKNMINIMKKQEMIFAHRQAATLEEEINNHLVKIFKFRNNRKEFLGKKDREISIQEKNRLINTKKIFRLNKEKEYNKSRL